MSIGNMTLIFFKLWNCFYTHMNFVLVIRVFAFIKAMSPLMSVEMSKT